MIESIPQPTLPCPDCGTEVASHFLICHGCHRLVHAEALKDLADRATDSERSEDWAGAMSSWRSALELLPTRSRQHEVISAKIAALGNRVDAPPTPGPDRKNVGWAGGGGGAAAGLGTIGLMAWKFKFVAVLALTKGKLLLLGLTKASTLFSMFTSLWLYCQVFGWPYAAGLIAALYIHEMGHVSAFLRYGIKTDPAMFIPGFGAFVRGRQKLANVREEAQVALAGPIWGVASVALFFGLYFATGQLIFAGIARLAAIFNLLNLIPFWILDGSHAFRAFSRSQRWLVAGTAATMLVLCGESHQIAYLVLLFLVVGATYRAAFEAPSKEPDRFSAIEYVALVVALSLATEIPAPLP